MEAANHWTYQPYVLNGSPIQVSTTLAINFALNQ